MIQDVQWIAADWGTTRLRVWLMRSDGTVLDKRSCDDGMSQLDPSGYEQTLRALVPELAAHTPVVICGMAGSRQGWAEAPYATAPCAPPSLTTAAQVAGTTAPVFILPGIKQTNPPDVMRGEETQIAGFHKLNPNFDGVICLPGTHTKWVQVSAGEVVSFRTFVTGEMFALLAGQSVLRHSVATEGWDAEAFAAAVDTGISTPARVAADLFTIRAEGLVKGLDPATARARLSGLLIGAELSASKPYWLGQQVAMLGAQGIAAPYAAALEQQGVPVLRVDAERMTLEGLKAAYADMKEHAT